jgi:hypothetical protein
MTGLYQENDMKDKPDREDIKEKKTYTMPEVKQVLLRPEEAVLGFCKTVSHAGPLGGTCNPITGQCSTLGS